MRSLLYIVGVVLVIGWILGALVYTAGSLIHILLVLAIISIVIGLFRKEPLD